MLSTIPKILIFMHIICQQRITCSLCKVRVQILWYSLPWKCSQTWYMIWKVGLHNVKEVDQNRKSVIGRIDVSKKKTRIFGAPEIFLTWRFFSREFLSCYTMSCIPLVNIASCLYKCLARLVCFPLETSSAWPSKFIKKQFSPQFLNGSHRKE